VTWDGFSPVGGSLAEYLDRADALILPRQRSETAPPTPANPAASGYPLGVPRVEVQATGHVLEAAGMDCSNLIDEPSAANNVLGLQDGVIADVGGGTTGIALLREGKVVRTADEPTGGTHFSLVVAGALNISFEKAEALKITAGKQLQLLPVVRPVMEKMARTCCRRLLPSSPRPGSRFHHAGGWRFGLPGDGRSCRKLHGDSHPGTKPPDVGHPAGPGPARPGSMMSNATDGRVTDG
jgi:hypothetical protein